MKKNSLLRIRTTLLRLAGGCPPLFKFGTVLRLRFPSRHVAVQLQHDHMIQGVALSLSRNEGIFVDVGANRGTHLRFFSECDPTKTHVAFEPLSELASELRSRFPSCEVHEIALSDRVGVVEFSEHVIPARSSIGGLSGSRRKFSVSMARGDDFLASKKIKLIKIDVEGHELEVLKGLSKTLASSKPHIVFEHGGLDFQRSTEIFSLLARHEYAVQSLLTGEVLTSERWLEVISGAEDYNFLATHSSIC